MVGFHPNIEKRAMLSACLAVAGMAALSSLVIERILKDKKSRQVKSAGWLFLVCG